ncbi:unnamed protein product [Amoebophrya sp. A120]|nr:unnamed protein product [Amoebophrya sp. A120]|eukprot:GSA120T00020502001.1
MILSKGYGQPKMGADRCYDISDYNCDRIENPPPQVFGDDSTKVQIAFEIYVYVVCTPFWYIIFTFAANDCKYFFLFVLFVYLHYRLIEFSNSLQRIASLFS